MGRIDPKTLLEAGAHFGHKTSRWHPKMQPYIYGKRGDIHIIDLIQTSDLLEDGLKAIEKVVGEGKKVLFVGTKRQARDIVRAAAESCAMPYVSERWLGGMLTNFQTISTRVKRMLQLESQLESGELAAKYSKLEVQRLEEEVEALNRVFGGIKTMDDLPGIVCILDAHGEQTAVKEANKIGLPIVGIVDTNVDPTHISYPVPANDDAIQSLQLIAEAFVQAVKTGSAKVKPVAASTDDKPKEKEA